MSSTGFGTRGNLRQFVGSRFFFLSYLSVGAFRSLRLSSLQPHTLRELFSSSFFPLFRVLPDGTHSNIRSHKSEFLCSSCILLFSVEIEDYLVSRTIRMETEQYSVRSRGRLFASRRLFFRHVFYASVRALYREAHIYSDRKCSGA